MQGAGAQATDPVSTFSDCVYAQQQPIARRRILSATLKVLKSASGRIHGISPDGPCEDDLEMATGGNWLEQFKAISFH